MAGRVAIHPDDRDMSFGEWQATARGAREFRVEFRFLHADGAERWATGRATATRGSDGEVSGFIGTVADITEIKLAESALRRVNERFEHALAGSDIGLWDWDVTTGRVMFSDRIASMLGYAPDEISRRT